MYLTVLGSSSKGNCYILQNETEALVIECGVSFKEVKKAVDFNLKKIVGAIVSHEHGDHAGHVNEFLNARINVFMSEGTTKAVKSSNRFLPLLLESFKILKVGNFTIMPFDVKHDVEEPVGFLIKHDEIGTLLFVTDSYYIPYCFDGLTNIMIEANYRTDILEANIKAGRIPDALRDRTLESHMSYDTCLEALKANNLTKVNNIILIHLSDDNSNEKEFREGIHRETSKTVYVAAKGLKIKLNKTPF